VNQESKKANPGTSSVIEQGALFNLWRFRTDGWNRLRDYARRLRRLGNGHVDSQLSEECRTVLDTLRPIESYFAFPGKTSFALLTELFKSADYADFARHTIRIIRLLSSSAYRRLDLSGTHAQSYSDMLSATSITELIYERTKHEQRPYFEVLIVDDPNEIDLREIRERFHHHRRSDDQFIYESIVVHTFEDAMIAALVNPNIESVLIRYSFTFKSKNRMGVLDEIYTILASDPSMWEPMMASERSLVLGHVLKALRPELDLFLVTDAPVENVAGEPSRPFRRVFYQGEDTQDLHLSFIKGISERYDTPFFSALKRYSQKPAGVFHALPISRGSTIARSHWIQDMGRFYGHNVFQAETSATTGGLDSLLQPVGPLKQAQENAARAFGARQSFLVTNGTSTANKIVMQSLIRPGDIVLLSHDCHKSHPYAVILSGARPIYLDAYPLTKYSMYGAVSIQEIKKQLIRLKKAGKLDQARMLLLTNITFDGVTYDPARVMEEVLAIKPDMVFVWDEAWFAYARFAPTLRQRTAMDSANRLLLRYRSEAYRDEYATWKKEFDKLDPDDETTWMDRRLMPDPEKVRIRVYATHSTHKTLTALRQGSMIHIHDQDFEQHSRDAFHEAYMTHTSTSPNYQILASLDVGRRQVELEGYEMVQRSIELAMTLRERVHSDSLLQKYFRVLGPGDMIPAEYRPSGLEYYYDPQHGWNRMELAWRTDEIVLEPTRVTLDIGRTGIDGDTFKKLLMDEYDIQINKTSRNTVLFMIHIGMTRGMIAHLVKVLTSIAHDLDDHLEHLSRVARKLFESKVHSLTEDLPPLPNFSRFHEAFLPLDGSGTPEGDIRKAFFLAYDDSVCDYVKLDEALLAKVTVGGSIVSASFVTPYPPGFPVLVPGQVMSPEILEYLLALDVKEIHGYEPQYGLRVFSSSALAELEGAIPDDMISRTPAGKKTRHPQPTA
jgi:arginine decarboxylase